MPGAPDPLYVRARAGFLDAVEALGVHLESVVLVGAQAIYFHTGDADLTVAEYTTDADFTLSPGDLADAPLVDELLQARGFTPEGNPGRWISPDGIYIDLMVPEALAGPGKRGARLGAHGKRAARRAKGLEGTLVDREKRRITSLDPTDTRTATIWVAGPAACSSPRFTRLPSAPTLKTAFETRTLWTFSVSSEPSGLRTWRMAFGR